MNNLTYNINNLTYNMQELIKDDVNKTLDTIVSFINNLDKGDLNFDPEKEQKKEPINHFFNELNIRSKDMPTLFSSMIPSKWIDALDQIQFNSSTGKTYANKLFHSEDKQIDLTNRVDKIFNDMKQYKMKKLILLDGHGRTIYLFCKKMIDNDYYFDIDVWELGSNTAKWHDYFFPQAKFKDELGIDRKINSLNGDISNSIEKEISNTSIYLNFCGIGDPIPGIIFNFIKYFKKYHRNNISLWVSGYKDHHEPDYLLQPQKTSTKNFLLNIIKANKKVGIWLLLSLISSGDPITKRINDTKVKDNITKTIELMGHAEIKNQDEIFSKSDILGSKIKSIYKINDLVLLNKILNSVTNRVELVEQNKINDPNKIDDPDKIVEQYILNYRDNKTDDKNTYVFNYNYNPKIKVKDYKSYQDKINSYPNQEVETVRWQDREEKNAAFVTWHLNINKLNALEKYNPRFCLDYYSDFSKYYEMLQEEVGFLNRTYNKYLKYKTKYLELKKFIQL